MCGIGGLIAQGGGSFSSEKLERMTKSLAHRGPDDSGLWIDAEARIGLGHRRLSIIDLSPEGHQPMVSASGRYVVAYNGEIYNYQVLKAELDRTGRSPTWRGHSDTEVLLAGVEAWGLVATLHKLVGMFAIALWDRQTSELSLARDRMGEKPLYYGNVEGHFAFASELKAFRAISTHALDIDRTSLSEFMRFGYVPAPRSIHVGIQKVPPGQFVTFSAASGSAREPVTYWSVESAEIQSLGQRIAGFDDGQLVDLLHDRLREAVHFQMVADVPLGAFLSGGVDSSLVVALMQSHSERRVRTYTIGFREGAFDEAPYARAVAQHLGTEHTELVVTPDDALGLIEFLPKIYDEPFADSSQIPTTLISRLTRQHVSVALTGDGGDELFAGYPRYQLTAALWSWVSSRPLLLRRALAATLRSVPSQTWDGLLGLLPAKSHPTINGRRMHLLAQLMVCSSLEEMYVRLMSRWQPEDDLVLGVSQPAVSATQWDKTLKDVDAMRLWDAKNYLPDDLLVKVDRAAMSASLETRAPLLDHRVVELAMALPMHALVRRGVGKWALRRVLDRYVPRNLIDRPKAGFEVPLGDWLRGPLRPWAQSLLDPAKLRREGYINAEKIGQVWKEHLTGRSDRSLHLWNVLMFEAWLDAGNSLAT